MSIQDDFNRFEFQRARSKYDRNQFDSMTHDHWVALVEGYRAREKELIDEMQELQDEINDLRSD